MYVHGKRGILYVNHTVKEALGTETERRGERDREREEGERLRPECVINFSNFRHKKDNNRKTR